MTTSADVRRFLTHALRLDVIGPEADEPQASEVLPIAPSRWYLTGFLVPWTASPQQKRDDDDTQGELEYGDASAGADEDDAPPEPRAARRSHFPSSMGLSVLVPPDAATLNVTARWGDYKPVAKDGALTGEWRRTERSGDVIVQIVKDRAQPAIADIPDSDGLQIVSSIRRVRGLEEMPGLPKGTRAVSVFLVKPIGDLISHCFYSDSLESSRTLADPTLRPVLARPVTWLSTSGLQSRREESSGVSFANQTEIRAIGQLLANLDKIAQRAGKSYSVAILSGYAGQVIALQRQIGAKEIAWPSLQIEVNTVDAFQGREADIAIYSITRSNPELRAGFLSEQKRLNVALSRARDHLVIVGDHQFSTASRPRVRRRHGAHAVHASTSDARSAQSCRDADLRARNDAAR
ncbi:MAG TPA: AAA domain-containing protein [Vicinamibacterales bacterium]